MPLFARTAPAFELGFEPESTREVVATRRPRAPRGSLRMSRLQSIGTPCPCIHWPTAADHCGGVRLWGHAALLAPSLVLLPSEQGELHCVCGSVDSLIPESDQQAIQAALRAEDPMRLRLRFGVFEGTDHGFICEARDQFHQASAEEGWRLLLEAAQS